MDTNIIIFKTISTFIIDLSELYGKRQHSLSLYKRLISKTAIVHEKAIDKNIDIFKTFCIQNREAIQSKNETLLTNPLLKYSDRVFINMADIFKMADEESKEVIWRHLLTISAFLDPVSNAKKILKEMQETETGSKEENFLTGIIEKVENSIDPQATSQNPMQAVASIMQSGVFTDLITSMQTGIESGELNINKLMGTVQGMLGAGQQQLPFDLSSLMKQLPPS
jgi:hypothetical protein